MFFRLNVYKIFCCMIFSVLATACVTETINSSPGIKFSDTAVVSVQDPNVVIFAGSTFAWLPEAVQYYKDKRLQDAPIKALIESEIVANLKSSGMQIVESVNGAQYAIAYTAALESSLDDSAIIRRFGLLPGNAQVPAGDSSVEKGTLVIYVFNNKSHEIIWRSAAQVSVKFDTPVEKRKQRVKRVIAEMFQTLPRQ